MSETSKQFLKRFLEFSIGPLISAVIGFITVPVTTYLVSPADFGKSAMYTMGYSISSLFIFLGLDQAFVREYNEQDDKKNLFWNCIIVPLIFSIILGGIYIAFNELISKLMFDSVEKYIVMILAFSLPFAVIDRFSLLVIRMKEKAKLYSLFNILNKLFVLLIMIPYLKFVDNSFKGIINVNFISLILLCFLKLWYVKEEWKPKFYINKELINDLFRFGLPLIPTSIITWLFSSMDRIALRQWSSFEEIGLYSAAFKIVTVLGIIQQAFSTFWAPTAFRWHKEDVDNSKYIEVSNILMVSMTILFSFIVLFKDIIIKMLSSNYVSASNVVPFLLFLPIMYTVSETTTLGISFSKKTSYNILISFVAAFTNYVGNSLLVPKLGALGASISTGISYIVFFWMRTLISRRLWFNFNLQIYIVNILLMVVLSTFSILVNAIYINIIIFLSILIYNRKSIIEILSFCKTTLGGIKNERYNFSRR